MKIDYHILKRYLEGRGTIKEALMIKEWFNKLENEKELRDRSYQYWEELTGNPETGNYDESAVLGRIYREIKIRESGKVSQRTSRFKRLVNFLSKVAAVLFVPLLILLFTKYDTINLSRQEITYTEVYSPPGTRTIIYLADGSRVWLNGGSSLKYPSSFRGNTRDVSLSGEAYFDIESNPNKPFVVSGKNLNVIARGTSLNLSLWDNVPESRIVLVEGKVDVFYEKNSRQRLVTSLNPGQLLHFVPSTTGSFVKDVEIEKYISWKEGKLIFRDDPLEEVVKRLNRLYNVDIIIEDDILLTYQYVATFEDENLDEILKLLELSAPIRYKDIQRTQSTDGTFGKRTIKLFYGPDNHYK